MRYFKKRKKLSTERLRGPLEELERSDNWRVQALRVFFLIFGSVIVFRLFALQVLDHGYYQVIASNQNEIFENLIPNRGNIYVHENKGDQLYPLATIRPLTFVWADPRRIEDVEDTIEKLDAVFAWSENARQERIDELKKTQGEEVIEDEIQVDDLVEFLEEEIEAPKVISLRERLSDSTDPYEPIQHYVEDDVIDELKILDIPGLHFTREEIRYYPEEGIGGHIIGFMGSSEDGSLAGRYGVEGYYDQLLAGQDGFLQSRKDMAGRWITTSERFFDPATDGADIVLTIDRTLQIIVCDKLQKAVEKYQADGGAVVIINPKTGAIRAMCGAPNFDSNKYNLVESISTYNNPAIFLDYEPGSIFKPLTMAAAIDRGVVNPTSTYIDTGAEEIDDFTIRNSDQKAYGQQTMTEVLEKSLNTGAIFAMRQIGPKTFSQYVRDFGFGEFTGIDLDTEVAGNISSLEKSAEVYSATASFGQGITVTPLQMVMAYGALANGGKLMKPYIAEKIIYPDQSEEITIPQEVRQVVSGKTARLLSAMMVSVIENGHGKNAAVTGYYIAGKTGTAQVASRGGYDANNVKSSFAGFGPVSDPTFAMITRIDHPRRGIWASTTAAPLFGDIASFLLQYDETPPNRIIE